MISVRNVGKFFGKLPRDRRPVAGHRAGRVLHPPGGIGLRQDHASADDRGVRGTTSGEIFIDGQPMSAVPPYLRPVNMVFQNYAIFPHLNVRDNIAYGLRRLGLPRARQDEMVDEMLDLVALPGYGRRRANELSGGQRQRVALARALILQAQGAAAGRTAGRAGQAVARTDAA
jgi:energy-coupling factor transporter ATP-binding protein EcfA2